MALLNWFSKAKYQLLCVLLGILTIVCAFGCFYFWSTRDMTVISDDSIREEIVPVAKVTTYEYNFTQILFLTDSGNPFGVDNPITSKRYLATIDGSIPLQVDASKIICKATLDSADALKKVKVKLPHSYVGTVALDHSTVKKYVEDNGWLGINSVSSDDFKQLLKQAETDQVKKVKDGGYLDRSDERVCSLIEAQLHAIHGKDVDVSFEFIEE